MRKKTFLLITLLVCLAANAALSDTLTLPASLAVIEAEAFAGDTSLDSAVIPEGTETIESRAFANSTLKTVTLPKSLSSIAEDAFEGCEGLTAEVDYASYAHQWCLEQGIEVDAVSRTADEADFTYADNGDGTATLTGYAGDAQNWTLPETIGNLSVTAIGESAFEDGSPVNVVIPKTVETIGAYAFAGCRSLETVELAPGSLRLTVGEGAFTTCGKLGDFRLPESFVSFEHEGSVSRNSSHFAFRSTGGNKAYATNRGVLYTADRKEMVFCPDGKKYTLTIPSGVTTVRTGALSLCERLMIVRVPESITEIQPGAINLDNPPYLEVAPDSYAHEWCEENGVPYIFTKTIEESPQEDFVVEGYENVAYVVDYIGSDKNVVVPRTINGCPVAEIGWGTFDDHPQIESITFQQGVQVFYGSVFSKGGEGLRSVSLPASLFSADTNPFTGCPNLAEVTLSGSNYLVKEDGAVYSADGKTLLWAPCGLAGAVSVPDGVETIAAEAFAGSAVAEMVLPEGVSSIGSRAFAGCAALQSIVLPESITEIGENAFDGAPVIAVVTENTYAHQWCLENSIPCFAFPNDNT